MKPLFFVLISFLILSINFGCQDEFSIDSNDSSFRYGKTLKSPKSIGPTFFGKNNKNKTDLIEYSWNNVGNNALYDLNLYVNNSEKPVQEIRNIRETSITFELFLEIDDVVLVEIRTTNGKDNFSQWIKHESINRNGGATVDMVFRQADWRQICDLGGCDYVRFIDNAIDNCNGGSINLNYYTGYGNYYSKESICDCLASYPTLCDGIENIGACLFPSYLKRNYNTCE